MIAELADVGTHVQHYIRTRKLQEVGQHARFPIGILVAL
jgi:hypothetical protein